MLLSSHDQAAPNAHLIVELQNEENMRYLHDKSGSMVHLDPGTLILQQEDIGPESDADLRALWPIWASGSVFCASVFDSLLAQSYHNDAVLPLITMFVECLGTDRENSQNKVSSAGLFQVTLPKEFVNLCCYYGDLHGLLLELCLIPIGLYRPKGTNEAPTAYTVTVPPAETKLVDQDAVFVIGHPEVVRANRQSILAKNIYGSLGSMGGWGSSSSLTNLSSLRSEPGPARTRRRTSIAEAAQVSTYISSLLST